MIPPIFRCSCEWARRCNQHRCAKRWFAFAFYKQFPSETPSQRERGASICLVISFVSLDTASDRAHQTEVEKQKERPPTERLEKPAKMGINANNVPIAEAGDTLSNLLKDRGNFLLADQGETRKKMGGVALSPSPV